MKSVGVKHKETSSVVSVRVMVFTWTQIQPVLPDSYQMALVNLLPSVNVVKSGRLKACSILTGEARD